MAYYYFCCQTQSDKFIFYHIPTAVLTKDVKPIVMEVTETRVTGEAMEMWSFLTLCSSLWICTLIQAVVRTSVLSWNSSKSLQCNCFVLSKKATRVCTMLLKKRFEIKKTVQDNTVFCFMWHYNHSTLIPTRFTIYLRVVMVVVWVDLTQLALS